MFCQTLQFQRQDLKRSLRNWSVTLNALLIRTIASMHLARAWFRSIGLPPCFALYISSVKLIRGNMDFVMEPCMLWSFISPLLMWLISFFLIPKISIFTVLTLIGTLEGRSSFSSREVKLSGFRVFSQIWTPPHRWGVLWVPLFGPSPVEC